ncbi:response regulator transcription factor [Vibrio rarus]|uniref:response regulator transcription factor n=1 Tax=Vibrio rarus TaxID=413403 RepID=UPI0021C3C36B|nr:response regulator transcription factor [Vibrio rarus]
MYFDEINSQLFLHESCEFDAHTIQQIEKLSSVQLHPLDDWHQRYKPSMNPTILINFNDTKFSSDEFVIPHSANKKVYIVLTQAPINIRTADLLKFGCVRGVFNKHQTVKEIAYGVEALSKGYSWLSYALTEQLLSYYQSVLMRYAPPHTINLTRREMEVLEALRAGKSNYELAEQLFISEHTIKSHLYKIFRKIKVKNREEAVIWAHHFLP